MLSCSSHIVLSAVLIGCVAIGSLSLHRQALAQETQSTESETFTLNLNNVDIRSLIETVSTRTGKNFIVDPRVKATVTVISAEPVSADRLYELFLSILDVHGYAAVPVGSVTKIVPMATGVQGAVPVLPEARSSNTATEPETEPDTKTSSELVTRVVDVEYIPVTQLVQALRPLLPQSAGFSAEPNSNTIVITDSADNIDRVVEIIRLLDRAN